MIYGIEAAAAVQLIGGGGVIGGSGRAVHFSGSIQSAGPTYLSCASLSCTDNSYFSFSLWQKGYLAPANGFSTLFVGDPSGTYAPYFYSENGAGADLSINFSNGSASTGRRWNNLDYSAWNHYLLSADLNYTDGNKIIVLYINDTLVAADSWNDGSGPYSNVINGKQFVFGDDTFGQGPTVDVADVWIAPGVVLHDGSNTIPEATRRQFINADLSPADPAGFPTSAIKFTGGASTFGTNLGTGGSFTTTGTLMDASTAP